MSVGSGEGRQQDKMPRETARSRGSEWQGRTRRALAVQLRQVYCLDSYVEVAVAEAVAIRHRFEDACSQFE